MASSVSSHGFGLGRNGDPSSPAFYLSPRENLQRDLIRSLRRAGARSRECARPLKVLDSDVRENPQTASLTNGLVRQGIIKSDGDLYWLDEATLGRVMRSRLERKKTLIALSLLAIVLVPVGILVARLLHMG